MNPDVSHDLALARRAAEGDERALRSLYDEHTGPLFAFVYHRLAGSRAEAEEVWQETWLAAVRSLAAYRGQSRLFTWLCAIARHKVADHCRRRGLPGTSFSDLAPGELASLMDAGPLPDEIVSGTAARTYVVEALAVLPADYRTALVARYVDDCSVDEVAQLLGKNYKATESLLARARSALRDALAGDRRD